MQIDFASEPGSPGRPNEDLALATPRTLIVLDGVTPHPGGSGCRHSVPWFTARLGAAMLAAAEEEASRPLADCLAAAITATAERHRGGCDLSHPHTPQSTVVAARIPEEGDAPVEYLVLSDSMLLAEDRSGVALLADDRLDRLRPRPEPIESFRNTEGGFFTAAADPSTAARAVTGTLGRDGLLGLALLTDGATRLVEKYGADDWAGTVARLRREGPESLLAAVRKAEVRQPLPHGKQHDDATAVWVELDG